MSTLRCAIYTRKSSEEGLDQAFNSLDAQREAGLDYIKSQRHEGWTAVKSHYDDGGYSGGTMKRPALERLLEDIDRGRIDVVVVYKVDRLSRSLSDFARMMQLFDEMNVSFVSVTQQYNTTTSMGRLTLNMLLSFAQFEREIAGERIRDKIAATKKKGYWVCGQPPLGYRLQHEDEPRGLYVIADEAEVVREIFSRYLESASLIDVAQSLNQDGKSTKQWVSSTGRVHGGRPLTQKYVHAILMNPVFIGKITHTRNGQTEIYDGLHEPIIEQAVWDRVRTRIQSRDRDTRHRWTPPHLLKGKLRTVAGDAMSPTTTQRPLTKRSETKQKRLVHYYVSQKALKQGFKSCPIKSINAEHLDGLVRGIVLSHLSHPSLHAQESEIRDHWIRQVIHRVLVSEERLSIELDAKACKLLSQQEFRGPVPSQNGLPQCKQSLQVTDLGDTVRISLRISIKKRNGKRLILDADGQELLQASRSEPDPHLVNAIGLAYRWHDEMLATGESISAYAKRTGVSETQVHRLLPVVWLDPRCVSSVLRGEGVDFLSIVELLGIADGAWIE